MQKPRCAWAPADDPLYCAYHDDEWGVPVYEDRKLFEFLLLEGAQAGLSWITILKRREGYRRAFADFDPHKVARFGEAEKAALRQDPGIIRNRLKIESAVGNARVFLDLQEEFGSFATYLWDHVDGKPILNAWESLDQVPVTTPLSDTISKDLHRRGMRFVGSTIIYAYLQAMGVVMDHTTDCFRYAALTSKSS